MTRPKRWPRESTISREEETVCRNGGDELIKSADTHLISVTSTSTKLPTITPSAASNSGGVSRPNGSAAAARPCTPAVMIGAMPISTPMRLGQREIVSQHAGGFLCRQLREHAHVIRHRGDVIEQGNQAGGPVRTPRQPLFGVFLIRRWFA